MNITHPKHTQLTRGNFLTHGFGKLILKLFGWGVEGELPDNKQCVVIYAPHTSNWDFVLGMAAMLAVGLRASWMGKHQIFVWPFKYILFWLGGLPTYRDKAIGAVEQRTALFKEHEYLYLALAPEGTRSKVTNWKTGFYHIAHNAGVPILPIYINYERKMIGISDLFQPTGDVEQDIEKLRAFYRQHPGKYPENAG